MAIKLDYVVRWVPMTLPETMKGALARPAGLERFGLCGTARPGAKGFNRVVCSEKHSWRAISTIPLQGGERYPGTDAARLATERLQRLPSDGP